MTARDEAIERKCVVFNTTSCGDTVHRCDVGDPDAPYLGGLLVRDGHLSAVIGTGNAPEPQRVTPPMITRITFGEAGTLRSRPPPGDFPY